MAGPPPPPPPPPPMGAPSLDIPGPPTKMPAGRDALLGDIQKGMRLKKTVTVDKSKPLLGTKPSSVSAGGPPMPSGATPGGNGAPAVSMAPQLGDIFAGGMPKLKSVNKDNRSGIVPPTAPKIPVPSASVPHSAPVPATPTTRPPRRNVPVAPSIPNAAPPPLPS
ncbi:hypothetical protein OXX59_002775, partial [Metschnikowia pulcherrima]